MTSGDVANIPEGVSGAPGDWVCRYVEAGDGSAARIGQSKRLCPANPGRSPAPQLAKVPKRVYVRGHRAFDAIEGRFISRKHVLESGIGINHLPIRRGYHLRVRGGIQRAAQDIEAVGRHGLPRVADPCSQAADGGEPNYRDRGRLHGGSSTCPCQVNGAYADDHVGRYMNRARKRPDPA